MRCGKWLCAILLVGMARGGCSTPSESKTSEKGERPLNLTDVIAINKRSYGYPHFSTCVQIYYSKVDGTQIPSLPFLVSSYNSKGFISASEGLIVARRKVEIQPGQLPHGYTAKPDEHILGPAGYVNLSGQQVIPFQYKYATDFHQGRARVSTADGDGLIDTAGNWIVPPGKYVRIDSGSEGRYPFQSEGKWGERNVKWGFLDVNGNEVIPPRFRAADPKSYQQPVFSEGLAFVTDDQDRLVAIDRDGNIKFALPEKAVRPHPFSEGLALLRIDPGVGKPFKYGFISTTGRVVIPAEYRQAWDFSEGLAPVSLNGEGYFAPAHHETDPNAKWGYIDTAGKVRIPFQFAHVGQFSNGLARVMLKNKKWGYIDKTGKIVIPCQFDWACDFDRDVASVWDKERICIINKSGRIIVRTPVVPAVF